LIRATPSSPRSATMSVAPNSRAELLAWFVAAHRDDPLRAQLLGGEHAEQTDGAVADNGNDLARADFGGSGSKPTGAEDVRGGEQARDQACGWQVRGGDEGAVGEGDTGPLGLGADGADELAVDARALVAGAADLTGVVRREE
jgi:hypothetical protein